jgi:hypothetical protein
VTSARSCNNVSHLFWFDVDYVNKPEKYKCLGITIDGNIFNKHNDQEKKTLVKNFSVLISSCNFDVEKYSLCVCVRYEYTEWRHWSRAAREWCWGNIISANNTSINEKLWWWGNIFSANNTSINEKLWWWGHIRL